MAGAVCGVSLAAVLPPPSIAGIDGAVGILSRRARMPAIVRLATQCAPSLADCPAPLEGEGSALCWGSVGVCAGWRSGGGWQFLVLLVSVEHQEDLPSVSLALQYGGGHTLFPAKPRSFPQLDSDWLIDITVTAARDCGALFATLFNSFSPTRSEQIFQLFLHIEYFVNYSVEL